MDTIFETEEKAKKTLSFVSKNLKKGGFFFGLMPDSSTVWYRAQKGESSRLNNFRDKLFEVWDDGVGWVGLGWVGFGFGFGLVGFSFFFFFLDFQVTFQRALRDGIFFGNEFRVKVFLQTLFFSCVF